MEDSRLFEGYFLRRSMPDFELTRFAHDVTDWIALRTSARWEKKIGNLIASIGAPVYLPMITKHTRYSSKARMSDLPLFPGYVFTSANSYIQNPAIPITARNKVAQVLKPKDPDSLRNDLLRFADLVQDRKLVQEKVVGEPGDRIVIVGGPLVGNEGKIIRLKPNRYAVIVEIDLIGAKLEVELSEGMIQKQE